MMNHYTGIGARVTTAPVLEVMRKIAKILAAKGYTLRSGGGTGPDSAFEEGCIEAKGNKEIFLPWEGFQGKSAKNNGYFVTKESHPEGYMLAKNLAKTFHPKWESLADAGKMLHTRNVHQVLGIDAKTPSKFVICSTPNGEEIGGTSQAIRVATFMKIPTYNLGNDQSAADLVKMLRTLTT